VRCRCSSAVWKWCSGAVAQWCSGSVAARASKEPRAKQCAGFGLSADEHYFWANAIVRRAELGSEVALKRQAS